MLPPHGSEQNPCACYKQDIRREQDEACLVCKTRGVNFRRAKPFHGLFCWPCGQMVSRIHKKRFTAEELARFIWRDYNASEDP